MHEKQRKTNWLRSILLAVIAVSTISGLAMLSGNGMAAPGNAQSPILGGWIPLRVDDIDNLASAMVFNSVRNEYLVVWEEYYATEVAVYARRVDQDGYLLGSAFPVAHYSTYPSWQPAVAYSTAQDKYLVVYSFDSKPTLPPFSDYNISAQPINGDGSITESGFSIDPNTNHQRRPAVTYNTTDDEFLVVWDVEQGAGGWLDIWAQRINASDWSFEPGPVCIATGDSMHRYQPDVAYNLTRNEYLIAYTREDSDGDIFAKRLPAYLPNPLLVAEIDIVWNTNLQGDVALAAGPDEYLVVWQDGPSVSWRTIYARRVAGDGTTPGPAFLIDEHSNEVCFGPDVAYGRGYGYLTAWSYEAASSTDAYGRYIMPGVNLPAGDAFFIDQDPGTQKDVSLACNPRGDCYYAESDNSGSTEYDLFGRMIRPNHIFLPVLQR
jgi:hypothetical protein